MVGGKIGDPLVPPTMLGLMLRRGIVLFPPTILGALPRCGAVQFPSTIRGALLRLGAGQFPPLPPSPNFLYNYGGRSPAPDLLSWPLRGQPFAEVKGILSSG